MDDASKLGPLWVGQLRKEVAARRNRAAENLLTINPDGDFAKQHRMLIRAADMMLEADTLLNALVELERQADLSLDYRPEFRRAIAGAHAAIAEATGSAA